MNKMQETGLNIKAIPNHNIIKFLSHIIIKFIKRKYYVILHYMDSSLILCDLDHSPRFFS